MRKQPTDPFRIGGPLSDSDRAVIEMFAALAGTEVMLATETRSAATAPRLGELHPDFAPTPRPWGRLTPENWNSVEACRRDNVRCMFDLSPSASPLPEFAGKTPALNKTLPYPCAENLCIVDECCKYYGYDPESSESCSREVLLARAKRCFELRLRYPDELRAVDMHELRALRSDSALHLRFDKEFPAESREMDITLFCHQRKWTREQAERHLDDCDRAGGSRGSFGNS